MSKFTPQQMIELETEAKWWATLQACKACACPTSKLEKELGVSNGDINAFTDGESYMSEARSWSDTPLRAVCTWGGVGDRSTSGWLLGYQGN